MHKNGIIHRDVKPDNFCLPHGVDPLNPVPVDTVYVVDMGMGYDLQSEGKKGMHAVQQALRLSVRHARSVSRCAAGGHGRKSHNLQQG